MAAGFSISHVESTPAGVVVSDIVTGTPAQQAGLQPGDVITSLDDAPISSSDDLRTALFPHHPGDTVTLGYTDTTGAAQTASITLASGPPQ